MAKRTSVPTKTRKKVLLEAGNKCANPGCSNTRTIIHHIKEWHIYGSHDEKILIAVCSTCHDAIHYGRIKISDKTLYSWKSIRRAPQPTLIQHLHIEPSQDVGILAGSFLIKTTHNNLIIFKLSEHNKLEFKILDSDFLIVSLEISNLANERVIRVVENHIREGEHNSKIQYFSHPGYVKVTTKLINNFISQDFLMKIRKHVPDYTLNGELTLLELEVIKPGTIKLKGCWPNSQYVFVFTNLGMSFIRATLKEPITIQGMGEKTILQYKGPVTGAMFGIRPTCNDE